MILQETQDCLRIRVSDFRVGIIEGLTSPITILILERRGTETTYGSIVQRLVHQTFNLAIPVRVRVDLPSFLGSRFRNSPPLPKNYDAKTVPYYFIWKNTVRILSSCSSMEEPLAHNRLVVGSNPTESTKFTVSRTLC